MEFDNDQYPEVALYVTGGKVPPETMAKLEDALKDLHTRRLQIQPMPEPRRSQALIVGDLLYVLHPEPLNPVAVGGKVGAVGQRKLLAYADMVIEVSTGRVVKNRKGSCTVATAKKATKAAPKKAASTDETKRKNTQLSKRVVSLEREVAQLKQNQCQEGERMAILEQEHGARGRDLQRLGDYLACNFGGEMPGGANFVTTAITLLGKLKAPGTEVIVNGDGGVTMMKGASMGPSEALGACADGRDNGPCYGEPTGGDGGQGSQPSSGCGTNDPGR